MRSDDAGDHATAVDVSREDNRNVRGLCESHIGDVALTQIGFGRTAGALDHDQIGIHANLSEAVEHERQQGATPFISSGLKLPEAFPLNDDLRTPVGFRLQQYRVHVNARCHHGGARLQRLRTPDLAALHRRRIVRHVLRLEWPHT